MPEERKPAYWTVLPARVRYDKDNPRTEVEITEVEE